MKIIWTAFAAETLKDIFDYYKGIVGKNIAHKIKIFNTTKQLKKQPDGLFLT